MYMEKMFIKKILEQSLLHAQGIHNNTGWQIQGLGMLRLYLDKTVRLHVWHNGLVYPDTPSVIHNHPWEFVSRVIVGTLRNVRYTVASAGKNPNHHVAKILCGVGGGIIQESVKDVEMEISTVDEYKAGETYYQASDELHNTVFQNGTVTLVTRKFNDDADHASVAYPLGSTWKTAEPREASADELQLGLSAALKLFD